MRIRLFDPAAHPRFDDLPWSQPLEEWEHARLVDMPAGLHRHVVRFVEYDGQFYALKELPVRLAEREYRLLRTLNDQGLPVVAAVALVDQRGEPDAVLITRYLHYAVPFRHLFTESAHVDHADPADAADVADRLVEAIATLLARLHTAGFYWGDCSLSNALFRRDELHLSGYALDTETGELHGALTSGQRRADVELAVINIAGGLADLAAGGMLPETVDPFDVAPLIADVYDEIWSELHGVSTYDPGDPAALEQRLERLGDLGFGVSEAVITDNPGGAAAPDDERGFSFRPSAIAGAYQRRELAELTGLIAREHQAQRLLDEIGRFRDDEDGRPGTRDRSLREVGHEWLTDVYDPVLAAVPDDVAGKIERPQLFIEILDHHDAQLDTRSDTQTDIATSGDDRLSALVAAAEHYASSVLARRPHERTTADSDQPAP